MYLFLEFFDVMFELGRFDETFLPVVYIKRCQFYLEIWKKKNSFIRIVERERNYDGSTWLQGGIIIIIIIIFKCHAFFKFISKRGRKETVPDSPFLAGRRHGL